MSSLTVLQEYDRFTYFVDTAQSVVIGDTIYRLRDYKARKTHLVGRDIVFMSGNNPVLDFILNALPDKVDHNGHIDAEGLREFLRKNFPPIDDMNSKAINGLVILSIVNGKTLMVAMKQSYKHFEIISSGPPASGIGIHVDGFNNTEINKVIIERNRTNIEKTGYGDIVKDIFDTYKNCYFEGVGGEILMYALDSSGPRFLHAEKLLEDNLRYVNPGINTINGEAFHINIHNINGGLPVTSETIAYQSVLYASNANIANYGYSLIAYGAPIGAVYVSSAGNLRPYGDGTAACGSDQGRWSSVWAMNGTIMTSDERQKTNIKPLAEDDRFLGFAKMITPYIYQMVLGTSSRWHTGFIAQRIEEAMIECNISDTEFAGLVKAPVYARNLFTEDGKDTGEYDTSSEIIDYKYFLRYEEFIPLIYLWLKDLEERNQGA